MIRSVFAAAAAFVAVGTIAAAADAPKTTTVEIKNAGGASIGQVQLTEAPNGVLLRTELKGLTPGWHGMHFHEKGDCSAKDFTSAGGHVHTQSSVVHGLLNPDANDSGDLPNIHVAADGSATVETMSPYVALSSPVGARPSLADADGSAVVIHANPDDHMTQPIGGAGARVACGVIAPAG